MLGYTFEPLTLHTTGRALLVGEQPVNREFPALHLATQVRDRDGHTGCIAPHLTRSTRFCFVQLVFDLQPWLSPRPMMECHGRCPPTPRTPLEC